MLLLEYFSKGQYSLQPTTKNKYNMLKDDNRISLLNLEAISNVAL